MRNASSAHKSAYKKPTILLVDKYTVDSIVIDQSEDTRYALDYLIPMMKNGVNQYIDNIDGEMKLLIINRKWVLPVFVPKSKHGSSYVVSLYSHYIRYAIEELHKLHNPVLQVFAKGLIRSAGVILKIARIDDCVYVNNWLLSTNLYTDFPAEYLNDISEFVAGAHPGKIVIWNSVNAITTPEIYDNAQKYKFIFLFSRSTYIHSTQNQLKSRIAANLRRESKLLGKSTYSFVADFDAHQAKELYNDLYITKYSKYNPMFNEKFMIHMHQHKLMTFRVLQDTSGVPKAIVGYYSRQGFAAAPILGYEISAPQKNALYRIISHRLLEDITARKEVLHASSGVGEFKRSRGASYTPEYRVIYLGGLGIGRKMILLLFESVLSRLVIPAMEKRKL